VPDARSVRPLRGKIAEEYRVDDRHLAGSACVLIGLLTGSCRHPGTLAVPYAPSPAADSTTAARRYPQHLPEQIGLPSLDVAQLPPGYREVRLEVTCDLCLPDYLVRLVEEPSGTVWGEGYVLASTFTSNDSVPRRRADSARASEHAEWRAELANSAQCEAWRPGQEDHVWCRTRRPPVQGWRGLLKQLDSLRVTTAGSVAGYNPSPPSFMPRGADTLPQAVRDSLGCGDVGGQGLTVASLSGAEYRTAHFWCLENPRGDEHRRAAAARARVLALFERDEGP
jgi:hypothetical protein